ncbi:MAG: SDR family oxidoreductase [Thermoprotei archaeon]|jgi:3-oxoacyl-[acyl-carrier protein] reductase
MRLMFKDKRVLVTASTSGIGYTIAKRFFEEGAKIVISSRNPDHISKAIQRLTKGKISSNVYGIPCDLTVYDDVKRLVTQTIEFLGGIDIFVYNSGNPDNEPATFFETYPSDWEYAVKLYTLSPVWLTLEIAPYMIKQGYGRIIFLGSVSIKEPMSILALADVTRISILPLTKLLAKELGTKGILVNAVLPGSFMTEGAKRLIERLAQRERKSKKSIKKEIASLASLNRFGSPRELANVVLFLASDAASFINGSVITVDGGMSHSIF